MQLLKSILHQARQIWDDSTGAARLGIGLMALIFVVAVVSVGVWSYQPSYVLLASDLTPAQVDQAMDALVMKDIDHQLKGSGSILWVDSRRLAEAKVAIRKVGVLATDPKTEEPNIFDPPFVANEKLKRNQEMRLEAAIGNMRGVKAASVSLGKPPQNPFMRKQSPSKASVMLDLLPGASFGERDARSIAIHVSHAVAGLDASQVAVTDSDGKFYETDPSSRGADWMEETKLKEEDEAVAKIMSQLVPIFQLENITVAVTKNFTFREGEQHSLEYGTDGVLGKQSVEEYTTDQSVAKAEGVVGANANQGRGIGGTRRSNGVGDSRLYKESDYLVDRRETTEKLRSSTLENMSVSVVVNKAHFDEDVDLAAVEERIKSTVASAVGLDNDRDTLFVDITEFAELPELVEPVASSVPWEQVYQVLEHISLGLAALVAFFIALRAFKKFSPEPVQIGSAPPVAAHVDRLADMVKENPEVFSQIIASWSELEPEAERESTLQVRNA